MRVLVQRVTEASVSVEQRIAGAIDCGLVVLVGAGQGDTQADGDKLAEKVANLRIFNDEQGKFNLSLLDVGGGALVISQFTLYADVRRGRRPSFTEAAHPEQAKPLYLHFAETMRRIGVKPVETGIFGAHMNVVVHNVGPVTIWLDSETM